MMNDASDEVYLAMPRALKARGFLAVKSFGDIFYIKVIGDKFCVITSRGLSYWESGGMSEDEIHGVDKEIRSYGH